MRTTVTLDEDIRKALDDLRRERGLGTSAALNELARRGLAASVDEGSERFRQRTSSMGLPRFPLDNIGEALEILEGPGASVIVDANVLLYARNESVTQHETAKHWLETALNGDTRVGLPWWSLVAFVRIATNARAFDQPLSAEDAALQIEEWLSAPRAWIVQPTAGFTPVFLGLLRRYRITAGLTTDAQLAALAIDHGVPLVSADADFARFREIDWINPFEAVP